MMTIKQLVASYNYEIFLIQYIDSAYRHDVLARSSKNLSEKRRPQKKHSFENKN